jgi:GTPase Era involved in 16S rRNA processing
MEHNKKSSLVSFMNLLHKVSIIKLETSKSKILNISCTEVFKVSIVSTLSSGKSTLINALIGQEILPSKNQACTSKTIAILDNNEAEEIVAHVLYKNNNYEKISDQITNVIESYQGLNEKSIKEIIIEGSIKGIHNTDCSLMLIDTPGVNNAGDLKHGIESMKYIEELDTGLIIYVLNAAQIGTNDELNYLKSIAEKLTRFPELELIFILNKMDNIDPEIEDPMTLIIKCHEYLSNIGFKSPQIIPVSSEAGLLFKKVLNRITLTLSEFYKLGLC